MYGYLILASKLYKYPNKFSGAWNFGTEKNTVTSVMTIVKYAIKDWGYGKLVVKKKNKLYEQENLQLNIQKSKNFLNWKPRYKVRESVKLTIDWYKNVLKKRIAPEKITKEQITNFLK